MILNVGKRHISRGRRRVSTQVDGELISCLVPRWHMKWPLTGIIASICLHKDDIKSVADPGVT